MDSRYRNYNIPKSCEHCGKTFYASRYDAKYCGSSCRTRASREAGLRDKQIQKVFDSWLDWSDTTRHATALTQAESEALLIMFHQIEDTLRMRDYQQPLPMEERLQTNSTE